MITIKLSHKGPTHDIQNQTEDQLSTKYISTSKRNFPNKSSRGINHSLTTFTHDILTDAVSKEDQDSCLLKSNNNNQYNITSIKKGHNSPNPNKSSVHHNTKVTNCYIPENFNIEDYPEMKYAEKQIYLWFHIWYSQKVKLFKNIDEPINLMAYHVARQLGKIKNKWVYNKHFIKFLTDNICTRDHYVVGGNGKKGKAYGFMLREKYRCKFKCVKIERKWIHYKEDVIKLPLHRAIWKNINKISIQGKPTPSYYDPPSFNNQLSLEQEHREFCINAIKNKDFFITLKDDFGDRLHWNGTNCPRDLKQYFVHEGEHFVELDGKNSQWFFLSVLLKQKGYQGCNKLMNLSQQGIIYDYFIPFGYDRETIKEAMIQDLLYKKGNYNNNKFIKLFKQEFPDVYIALKDLKKHGVEYFCQHLQKAESKFWIYTIGEHLASRNIYFLPIHDCLLVHPKDVEYVKNLIKYSAEREYNMGISIKENELNSTFTNNKPIV